MTSTDKVSKASLLASMIAQMEGLFIDKGFHAPSARAAYDGVNHLPGLEPGMLVVRVKVTSMHQDVKPGIMMNEVEEPFSIVAGREVVGVVVAVANGIEEFNVGDRVGTLFPRGPCGKCGQCRCNLCDTLDCYRQHPQAYPTYTTNVYAPQYVITDPAWTVHLPDTMGFTKAAKLMEAGAAVYCGLMKCGLQRSIAMQGKNSKQIGLIGIAGGGELGMLAIQFAKAMGYTVVAIDTGACQYIPEHLQPDIMLRSACVVLGKVHGDFRDHASCVNPGHNFHLSGLDAVLICTGSSCAFAASIELLAQRGKLVCMVQPEEPVPICYTSSVAKEIGVYQGGLQCVGGALSRCDGCGRREGRGLWMERGLMRDMLDLVERVGLQVDAVEYGCQDMRRGVYLSGGAVLRVEDDWEGEVQ